MLNVVELPQGTLADIANVLRCVADEVDGGRYGDVKAAVIVLEDTQGNVRTFGGGAADYYRGMALLQLGLENLLAKRGREYML